MLTISHVTVDQKRIGYATDGSGAPLVLLHGLGFDHRSWGLVAGYLAGHFQLLIPDLPGIGHSKQASWDGTPEALYRMVAGFLTATHAVPAFLAGSGLGGALALVLAARYPDRVRGIIAVGATGFEPWPQTSQAGQAKLARSFGLLDLALQLAPKRHAQQLLNDMFASNQPPDAMVSAIAETLADPISRRTLVQALTQLDQWPTALRHTGGIRVPVLLIWGENDRIYGLPQAERLRHAIPGARLHSLPGAGHALALERPAELAAVMRQAFRASL
jgi:pimeloyl-ACP methyl ester carboxylesterase